jgi:hypothetical protein
MHSQAYLRAEDFTFRQGDAVRSRAALVPDWSAQDRVVIVAPDPVNDLLASAGLVLALTHAFYDRPVAHEPGFFDYPAHFVIGGEAGARPQILGPVEQRPWSRAWCRLDVWPSSHHAVADPSPESLCQAAFMLEPTRLLWPRRLPRPDTLDMPAGPDHAGVVALWRQRLHQILRYTVADEPRADWSIELDGTSRALARDAAGLLPGAVSAAPAIADATFADVPVADFLA